MEGALESDGAHLNRGALAGSAAELVTRVSEHGVRGGAGGQAHGELPKTRGFTAERASYLL